MLSTAELIKQVRRIEIGTRHAVTEVFAGEYSSAFKGRGVEFADVREYEPGDDIRSIDWNVTARVGRPFVKRFTEERELTVVLAVDLSASGAFGSVGASDGGTPGGSATKRGLAIEVCAVLAFAALKKNDRVALLGFTEGVELYLPAGKGRRHTLRLVRELLAFEPGRAGTSLAAAADHLAHVLKRRSVVFLVSDFLAPDAVTPLRALARRHEAIAVRVSDPREHALPARGVGLVEVIDAESGERTLVDASSRRVRTRYAAAALRREESLTGALRRAGVDQLDLSTGRPYIHDLALFFRARERRR